MHGKSIIYGYKHRKGLLEGGQNLDVKQHQYMGVTSSSFTSLQPKLKHITSTKIYNQMTNYNKVVKSSEVTTTLIIQQDSQRVLLPSSFISMACWPCHADYYTWSLGSGSLGFPAYLSTHPAFGTAGCESLGKMSKRRIDKMF